MKKYIRFSRDITDVSGTIADTGERCTMRATGSVRSKGRTITLYTRTDKKIEYDDKGRPVRRQYSMDRRHRFYLETEDWIDEYELKYYGE